LNNPVEPNQIESEEVVDLAEINLPPRKAPEVFAEDVDSFDFYNLPPEFSAAIAKVGWTRPTPVQNLCLPHTLQGRDVAGFAQTGTGKTGVFIITAAARILKAKAAAEPGQPQPKTRCIILAPTRELAMQIQQDCSALLDPVGISSLAVFGGIDYVKQAKRIESGVDIIVATPGRLKDYHQKKLINLQELEIWVCDEADRMFDMGFIDDVEYFLGKLDEKCQRLLFSATTNDNVKELAFEYLENPEYISVTPETITPEKIQQHAVHVDSRNKLKVMIGLLRDQNPDCAIIFTNTKLTAEWLHFKLENNGFDVDLITGDLPQKKRIRLIQRIKEGTVKVLIATDVASRGLHISRVTHVFNFDLPDDASNYVHRIGRTARAGASGTAYSLVCEDYGQNLVDINKLLGTYGLKTEWFNESYLGIDDKAGNPFDKPMEEGREERSRGPRELEGGRRERGPRPERPDRSGGDRGDRQAKSQHGGKPGEQRGDRGPQRGRGRNSGRDGGQKHQQDGRDGSQRQHGGRGQRPDHRRDQQRGGQQHAQSQHKQNQVVPVSSTASLGLLGFIKKLFRALFGGGK
jgi:ATP-dependent RNA helicase RhlB